MESFRNQIINISNGKYTQEQLVSILLLCVSELDINTVSEIARQENKTPKGVRESKNYRKIMIGKQKLVVNGLKETGLPFQFCFYIRIIGILVILSLF